MLATQAHERVLGVYLHAHRLHVDQLGEDVGDPIEEGARQHRALDPLALRVLLDLERPACCLEASARNVDSVLDVVEQPSRQRLDVLIESGDYLLSILNDILDVSKIDAERLDILPTAEEIPLILERLVAFWGPRADEKGVTLILDIQPTTPAFVLVDALRLRQVLFNLVGNALKFTDEGSVSVIAKATPNGEGAVLLHIAVADTGMGIAPDLLPQLFTRFTQGEESEVRRFGG